MCSVFSQIGVADRFSYSVSKGAVHAMTLSIARDCAQFKIRCNNILPTRIDTPLIAGILQKHYPTNAHDIRTQYHQAQPLGRMAFPVEVAKMIAYLASDDAEFITGCDFTIDGGFTHLK
ncbi:MAG: SDR family oxidoreductase [Phycisphaerales bacterium]|nr:SDR family oxidoreductase [Phycisphaerales bacterium]